MLPIFLSGPARRTSIYVAALLLLPLACVLYATLPPSPDNWIFQYTGWLLTQGAVPYETFVDGNWPAAHWLHALSVRLLGVSMASWRIFDFFFMLLCTLAGVDLIRRLWGRGAGFWMLLLYPYLYITAGRWFAGQRDILGAHMLLVVLWAYWRGMAGGRWSWQIIGGVALGFGGLIKPTVLPQGVFLTLHAALGVALGRYRMGAALGQISVLAVVSSLTLVAGLGVIVMSGIGPETLWAYLVELVGSRFGGDTKTPSELALRAAVYAAKCWHWLVPSALLAFAWVLVREGRERLPENLLFVSMGCTALVAYVLQGQGHVYTLGTAFTAMIPVLCAGMARASDQVWTARGLRQWACVAWIALVLTGTAKKCVGSYESSAAWLTGRIDRATHYAQHDIGDGVTATEALQLADYLRARVPENETVFVWGRANAINALARRSQPTRFYHAPILMRPSFDPERQEEWLRWFEQDLARNRAAYAVVDQRGFETVPRPWARAAEQVWDLMERDYRKVRSFGRTALYERREREHAGE